MTEKLKEIVENATVKRKGTYNRFLVISNGEYNGFWGKNGFDALKLFGYDVKENEWYLITDSADVFCIFSKDSANYFSVDIPSDLGVPTFFTGTPIKVDNSLNLSSVNGEVLKHTEI